MTPEEIWADICDEVRRTKDLYLGELEACEDIIVEAIRQAIVAERNACVQAVKQLLPDEDIGLNEEDLSYIAAIEDAITCIKERN